MRALVVLGLAALTGCEASNGEEIGPDPSDGTGEASVASGASSGDSSGPTTGGAQGLGYENGSRLRARVYVGADGSRQFVGWRDTERQENCAFSTASDGKVRCLPQPVNQAASYFADASCTQPLATVFVSACSQVEKYSAWYNGCGTTSIGLTQAKFAGATVYYKAPGCTSGPTPGAGSFDLYLVESEIPPTDFAEASESVE